MRLHLLDRVALVDVAHQDLPQQVLRAGRHELGDRVVAGQDLLVEHRLAVLVERQKAAEHRVERDPAAPHVHRDRVVQLPVYYLVTQAYLRSRVARRPARSLQLLVVVIQVPQSEIDQFQVLVFVDENVGGLNISMCTTDIVKVFDCRDEFTEEFASLDFGQPAEARLPFFFFDIVGQFSILCVLHNEEKVLVCLDDLVTQDYLIELDDVGVLDFAEDIDFSPDSNQVVFLFDLLFLQDLDGDLFA